MNVMDISQVTALFHQAIRPGGVQRRQPGTKKNQRAVIPHHRDRDSRPRIAASCSRPMHEGVTRSRRVETEVTKGARAKQRCSQPFCGVGSIVTDELGMAMPASLVSGTTRIFGVVWRKQRLVLHDNGWTEAVRLFRQGAAPPSHR